MAYVYKITSPSGKIYVGSTIDIVRRKTQYRGSHCKLQKRLHYSIQKYSFEAHLFEIILECDKSDMRRLEAEYGAFYEVLGPNGLNSLLPKKDDIFNTASLEYRENLRQAQLGRKHSKEVKEKISRSRMGNKYCIGRKYSAETIRRMSEVRKGIPKTKDAVEKHRISLMKHIANRTHEQVEQFRQKSNAKIVLNTETGIFYYSSGDAARHSHYKKDYLRQMLNGYSKNKTSFIYA